jgi:hypothetical protein
MKGSEEISSYAGTHIYFSAAAAVVKEGSSCGSSRPGTTCVIDY